MSYAKYLKYKAKYLALKNMSGGSSSSSSFADKQKMFETLFKKPQSTTTKIPPAPSAVTKIPPAPSAVTKIPPAPSAVPRIFKEEIDEHIDEYADIVEVDKDAIENQMAREKETQDLINKLISENTTELNKKIMKKGYLYTKEKIDSILNNLKIELKEQFKTDDVFNRINKDIQLAYLTRFK
jgi:hypothetical protein